MCVYFYDIFDNFIQASILLSFAFAWIAPFKKMEEREESPSFAIFFVIFLVLLSFWILIPHTLDFQSANMSASRILFLKKIVFFGLIILVLGYIGQSIKKNSAMARKFLYAFALLFAIYAIIPSEVSYLALNSPEISTELLKEIKSAFFENFDRANIFRVEALIVGISVILFILHNFHLMLSSYIPEDGTLKSISYAKGWWVMGIVGASTVLFALQLFTANSLS